MENRVQSDNMEPPTHSEEVDIPPSPLHEPDKESQKLDLERTRSLEKQVSIPRELLVIGLISLAQLTAQIAFGQVLAILHIIGDHFNITEPGVLSWLIAGYSLTVGTFILFSGRLGDLFGWKLMLVIGYAWFALWSIISGLAAYSNHVLFIFSRVLTGIGPAISLPNALALLGGLYRPGMKKNLAFAFFGGCAPAGAIIGSLLGGLFALAWWPWAFWSLGIALAIIAVVAYFTIPDPQDEKPGIRGEGLMDAVRELDLLGATTGITALVLFNFAWNQAPIVGWQSPYVIVILILGVLLMPLFFYIEIKVAQNPLLPFDVFTANNAFVLACVACGWANFGIWVFYLWQILEILRGTSPLLAVAYLSPLAVSGMIAALTTGYLLGHLRPSWVMTIALCMFLTGTILVATLPPFQIYWGQIFVTTIVATFGMDMSFPSATLIVSDSVDKKHQGIAASLVNTIVNYSISLGLGFAGTVEVYVHHSGATEAERLLNGYRSALYVGIGLDALGLLLAVIFLLKSYWQDRRNDQIEKKEQSMSI